MEAAIFIGIQASGKSSFYRAKFDRSHVRINLDTLKTRHREKVLLDECIHSLQSFVVDNTNPTIEDRARYIHPAKEAGFKVVGYFFEASVPDSISRNKKRSRKEQVPDAAIRGTTARMQPPSFEEGFDELHFVRIDKKNEWIVDDWKDLAEGKGERADD